MFTRRILMASTIIAAAAACADTAPSAPTSRSGAASFSASAGGVETNIISPLSMLVFVGCANGGAGESVSLDGSLHILINTTVDAQGGIHMKTHFQPQNLSGIGLTTGDMYRGTGVTQDQTIETAAGVATFINNYRMIGQGPGNNFMVHENLIVTVNANGEVTASQDNYSVTCN